MKLCNSVAPEHHDAFMETIIYEAEMRRKDPVHGCLGVVCDLSAQIFCMEEEIEAIQQEILFCKNHEGRAFLMNQQRQFDGIQLQQPPPPMLFNPVTARVLQAISQVRMLLTCCHSIGLMI